MSDAATDREPIKEHPQIASDRAHLDYLDGIRGLAAVWVVLQHCCSRLGPLYASQGWKAWAVCWITFGHLAVSVFIVLSGYCLTLPVRKEGILQQGIMDFFRRRAWRILPPYYAALALGVALRDYAGWTHWQDAWRHGLWINLLMLQDVLRDDAHDNNIFDPPTWTVVLEWKIYFLFPLFLALLRRYGVPVMVSVAAGIGFGAIPLLHFLRPSMPLGHTCPWYVFLFALGMTAAWLQNRAGDRPFWPVAAGAGRLLLFVCLCGIIWRFDPVVIRNFDRLFDSSMPLADTVTGGLVALCLFLTGLALEEGRASRLARLFSWRPLVALGLFAYSLYLTHMPFLWVVNKVLHLPPLSQWIPWTDADARWNMLFGMLCLPFCTVMAYLFYIVIERPCLRKKQTLAARTEPTRP